MHSMHHVGFSIKTKPHCKDATKHYWDIIRFSRYLPQHLRSVIDLVLQNNAFSLHTENIILAILSGRSYIKELDICPTRYLSYFSSHPLCHKIGTIYGLVD